jgi:hypothetical protein
MGHPRRAAPQLAEPDLAELGGFPFASGEDGDQVVETGGDAIHIVTLRHRVASPARVVQRWQPTAHRTRLRFSAGGASARRRAGPACVPGAPG